MLCDVDQLQGYMYTKTEALEILSPHPGATSHEAYFNVFYTRCSTTKPTSRTRTFSAPADS